MNRELEIEKSIRFWQRLLNFNSWQINFKIKKFERKDYLQSGDVKVDVKNKKATIILCDNETGRDDYIILHELLHLILWEYDNFCEAFITNDKKNQYFELLEKTVKDLTDIIHRADVNKK